jgi:amino acid transporter
MSDLRSRGVTAAPPHAHTELPRRLGVWSAVAVLVGSTIGSGIFRVPSSVAEATGAVGAASLLWILGGIIAVAGALTIAELAAMYPRSGGVFVYIREAWGPLPAFLFGWTELIVIRPSALGAIAMLFAEYTRTFLPDLTELHVRIIAGATIALLALTNYRSLLWAAVIENTTTAAKVLALVGLAAVAFIFGDFAHGALAGPISFSPLSWGGFGVALIAVMWAYDGWADLTFIAGEVKDPGRTLPRALLGGVAIIMVVYLAVNLAYLFVLTLDEMAGSSLVAADTATRIFGRAGAAVVGSLVMLSAFGALTGSMMTGPRIFWAMADDRLFFKPIAAVHPKFGTPHVAIMLAALLGILYVSIRTFEQLADAFILGIWPFYALAVGAVFILRRRHPEAERPYRTIGYPIVPLIFLVASVGMLANAVVEQPVSTLIGFGAILVGVPVFYVWRRRG